MLFHFGEFSRIVKSFEFTKECFSSNTLGTFKVLNFCKNRNIKLIYSASSSKFGNNGADENLSPYSWTKSKNIELIKNFSKWFGLKYEIVYFFNVYGPGHSHYGKLSAVIGIFEGQYLQNKPLTVVSPGTQLRDFTHVYDIVHGTYLAWKKNLNKEYMLGTGKTYTINYIAKLFNHNIEMVPSRPGERIASAKTNNETYKILGYKPKINIEKYIKDFVKNNKKNKILIIGAGRVGCTVAEILSNNSYKVKIVDSRNHVAGNCYDYKNKYGNLVHKYGPHYFRTNSKKILKYLSKFTKWIPGEYLVNSYVDKKYYEFPINLNTINKFFNKSFNPVQAKKFLTKLSIKNSKKINFETYLISKIGKKLYMKNFIKIIQLNNGV